MKNGARRENIVVVLRAWLLESMQRRIREVFGETHVLDERRAVVKSMMFLRTDVPSFGIWTN
jgi:hypothetical protein